MTATLHLISTPGRAVLVAGAAPLLGEIDKSFKGWQAAAVKEGEPEIVIRQQGAGFSMTAPQRQEPEVTTGDAALAAYELTSILLKWFGAESPQRLLLHSAAVSVRGGQLLLAGPSGAGKSTLSLQLLSLGHRLFGDDMVAVELTLPPRVSALGFYPKLRLPLPPGSGPLLQEFVTKARKHTYPEHLQLCLDDDALALPGEREPVVGLVLLNRQSDGPLPQLTPLPSGDALLVLLQSYIAPHLTSDLVVQGLGSAIAGLPLWRLGYGDSRLAANFLHQRFGQSL